MNTSKPQAPLSSNPRASGAHPSTAPVKNRTKITRIEDLPDEFDETIYNNEYDGRV